MKNVNVDVKIPSLKKEHRIGSNEQKPESHEPIGNHKQGFRKSHPKPQNENRTQWYEQKRELHHSIGIFPWSRKTQPWDEAS